MLKSNLIRGSLVLATLMHCAFAEATVVNAKASADSFLSVHPSLGSGNAPMGNREYLASIGAWGYESYPIVRFNLSGLAGKTVNSDATLSLSYLGYFADPRMTISLYAVNNAWSEASSTWNNYSPAYGPLLSTTNVDVGGLGVGDKQYFTVPQATVQGWIDNGASNFGVFLVSDHFSRDISWASREYTPTGGAQGSWSPTLSFGITSAVPEPETYAMLLAGIGLIAPISRRRKQQ